MPDFVDFATLSEFRRLIENDEAEECAKIADWLASDAGENKNAYVLTAIRIRARISARAKNTG